MAGWAGCRRPATAATPPEPGRFDLRALAEPAINRDPSGHPLSVVVRVYQLKGRTRFSRLTFDLAASGRPDPELLEGDFLDRSELVLVPDAIHNSTHDLHPDTRYLGLVALFRQPDPHYWRYLVSLDRMTPPQARRPRDWPLRPWRRRPAPRGPNPKVSFRVLECALGRPEPGPETIPGQPERAAPVCPETAGARGPRP